MELRESFGDRKIPQISRKITACVACRKLKVSASDLFQVHISNFVSRLNVT